MPGFTLRLRGDFLCSIAYVFCSDVLATLWQHYMASHNYMPLQITYGIRVEGNAQAPRGDGTDGGCVGSGKWNPLHKLLVSCPTLFHTFATARSHFLLYVVICECFLAPPHHIGLPNARRLCSDFVLEADDDDRHEFSCSFSFLFFFFLSCRYFRKLSVVAILKPQHPEQTMFLLQISILL